MSASEAPALQLPELATRSQVAEYLQVSIDTLARWATEDGRGPKFIRLGGRVRYRRDDVVAYITALAAER